MYNRRFTHYDVDDLVHERARPPGRTIPLEGVLLHWRGRSMDGLTLALNRYATIEAEAMHTEGVRASYPKVAGRPALRFLWCFLWKGGWRHGTRGLLWSTLRATAEALRWAKLWELQHVHGDTRDPPADLLSRSRR
jgi:(heptosyl)LPS beta-1,4-glucosyltransferase